MLSGALVVGACGDDDDPAADPDAAVEEADAAPEGLSSEADLLDRKQELFDYFEAVALSEFSSPVDGAAIKYKKFDFGGDKALVISPGAIENMYLYTEFIMDLEGSGFDVYIIDHRGQGFSDRLLEDTVDDFAIKHHVDAFESYRDDFGYFVETYAAADHPGEVYGWAHSMGGAIMLAYAEDPETRGTFNAVVVSAPMLGIQFWLNGQLVPEETVRLTAETGVQTAFANGVPKTTEPLPFADNIFTLSENRYQMTQFELATKYGSRMAGPTNGWIMEAIDLMRFVRDNASGYATPTLLLQAGQDQLVDLDEQDLWCETTTDSGVCTKTVLTGKHELHQAPDEVRTLAIEAALEHFAAN